VTRHLAICYHADFFARLILDPEVDVIRTYETLVPIGTIQRCIQDKCDFHNYRYGNLKSYSWRINLDKKPKKENAVASVRERTIPIERPPLVGEVSANFCGRGASRSQHGGSLRPYSRFSGPEPLLVLPSSSSVVLTRLSEPRSRPTTSQKIW
jgi:hypothetical protein